MSHASLLFDPTPRVLSTVSNHRHCYRSNTSLPPSSLCVNRWNCSGSFSCFALELQDWLHVLFQPLQALIPLTQSSISPASSGIRWLIVVLYFLAIVLYHGLSLYIYTARCAFVAMILFLSLLLPFFYVCVYIYRCTALFTKKPTIHYILRLLNRNLFLFPLFFFWIWKIPSTSLFSAFFCFDICFF